MSIRTVHNIWKINSPLSHYKVVLSGLTNIRYILVGKMRTENLNQYFEKSSTDRVFRQERRVRAGVFKKII